MTNNPSIELNQEQIDALIEFGKRIQEIILQIRDALAELFQKAFEVIKKFVILVGRMLFKYQLLELRIPYWLANYLSEKIYYVWACHFGFSWLKKKVRNYFAPDEFQGTSLEIPLSEVYYCDACERTAEDAMDLDTREYCGHCGKELEDFSDLGCSYCDKRVEDE